MSTQEREIIGTGIAGLVGTDPGVSLDAQKSLVQFLWQPYADIKIVGPDGLWIRLGKGYSYYGQGKPQETREDYEARSADRLLRCQAYPCWNINYMESLHNLGKFTPEQQAQGNALGAPAGQEEVTIYAGVCAADMVALYGESYGLCSLAALVGMEDIPTVEELIKIVQPYAYKLTNLQQEEQGRLEDEQTLLFDLADKGPAYERIQGAGLDALLKSKAAALRTQMLARTRRAAQTARTEWFELKKQLANAALGKVGFKAMPSSYDEHLAFLLGEAVPSAVARPTSSSDPELSAAVKLLTQHVVGGGQVPQADAGEISEMRSLVGQMRSERVRLEKLKKEFEEKGIPIPQE